VKARLRLKVVASLSEPWNVVVSSAFQQEESRLAKIVFLMIRHREADVAKLESPRSELEQEAHMERVRHFSQTFSALGVVQPGPGE